MFLLFILNYIRNILYMSRVASTSEYAIVAPNIVFESISSIRLNTPITDISGNLNVEGYIHTKSFLKNNVEIFNTIKTDELITNKVLINGPISSNLLINGSITANSITTPNINLNNGVINIANGIINGPVKIYGLEVVNTNQIFTSKINFKSTDTHNDYSFNIENINTPPPDENCVPTWIKVKINGASFYIFSQMIAEE
jgi:hypothetical protein